MVRKKLPQSFEAAISELEALVESMEKGELSLEETLQNFERGVSLTKSCQQALEKAEQRVRILSGEGESAALESFESDD